MTDITVGEAGHPYAMNHQPGYRNTPKPAMKTMWVNVYRTSNIPALGGLFDSRDAALKYADVTTYLCTCPIEIPDLEGK